MNELTLADMLDPKWWTVGRMALAVALALMAVTLVKALIQD